MSTMECPSDRETQIFYHYYETTYSLILQVGQYLTRGHFVVMCQSAMLEDAGGPCGITGMIFDLALWGCVGNDDSTSFP